jgi:hypothetical protein
MNVPDKFQPGDTLKRSLSRSSTGGVETEYETVEWLEGAHPDHPPDVWAPQPFRVPGADPGYVPADLPDFTFPAPTPRSRGNGLWNLQVFGLRVHDQDARWKAALGMTATRKVSLHPDFSNLVDGEGHPQGYGIPVNVVPWDQPLRPVTIDQWPDESDPRPGGYPIPDRAWVEVGSDKHLLVAQKVTPGRYLLYEFGNARVEGGTYRAYVVAVWDTAYDAERPQGWTSTDAAGLPILPGLVRWPNVTQGGWRQAIRCTVYKTCHGYIAPASHEAGSNPDCPPMGARIRLKSGFDIGPFSVETRTLLQQLKNYGMIVVDNSNDGTRVYLTGEPGPDVNDTKFAEIKYPQNPRAPKFPDDFEFVDAGVGP